MKHKFKPSIGGNRGKKGVPGGGKREKETPHTDKTAGPSLESTAGIGLYSTMYIVYMCIYMSHL